MKKRIIKLPIFALLLIVLSGCDTGLEIVDVEIGGLPSKVVYRVNEDTELDLTGITLLYHLRSGAVTEHDLVRDHWETVEHNIDFSKADAYEVVISRPKGINQKELFTYRYTVQVIE